jgi:hypothetical protein
MTQLFLPSGSFLTTSRWKENNMTQTEEHSGLVEYSKESLEAYLKTLSKDDPKVELVKAFIKSIKD